MMPYQYEESQVIDFQKDVRETYAEGKEPYHIDDDSHVIHTARMQYDAERLGYPFARAKHLHALRVQLEIDSVGSIGQIHKPTRAQACSIRRHFQGLTIHSNQYGYLPWFPAALISFETELDHILDQLIAAEDTHCQIDLKWSYGEPGQPWGTTVPGRDLSNDYPTYLKICDRVIQRGLIPIFTVLGEGQDGFQWIKSNFQDYVNWLKVGYDRTAYGPIYILYDGVWPASWSVSQVKEILPFMREILGNNAYLGMMFACGPAGNPYYYVENQGDYKQAWMQSLDFVMMSTGPAQVECPSLCNGMQYLLGPSLTKTKECTPEWNGPWLMSPGTPRGPYFAGFDEWNEYEWVRGHVTKEKIDADRARMESIGIMNHG